MQFGNWNSLLIMVWMEKNLIKKKSKTHGPTLKKDLTHTKDGR